MYLPVLIIEHMDQLINLMDSTHTWDPECNLVQLKASLSVSQKIIADQNYHAAPSHIQSIISRYNYMVRMLRYPENEIYNDAEYGHILTKIGYLFEMAQNRHDPLDILSVSVSIDRYILERFC